MFGMKSKAPAEPTAPDKDHLFKRLQRGLRRTQTLLFTDVEDLFSGDTPDQEQLLEALEDHLLMSDMGITTTTRIMGTLRTDLKKNKSDPRLALKSILESILAPVTLPLQIPDSANKPFVIMVTGVNGAGKTTSIGKLAKHFQQQGHSVMLAAGDTFRAAAIEQLQSWGERNEVPVIVQKHGSDSAAVIFDALQAARARKIDILIADTAGRLHTQSNLMDELKKIRRIINKFDTEITPECLLVLDAGTGQNALNQARLFNEAIGITGLMLTKLDGTAKGGIIFALANELKIPVRYIGVGENIDDLQEFNSKNFVTALFTQDS